MTVPIVCFVGRSNSGKTTFIERIIPELVRAGYKIATVKHAGHGFDLDTEGKDRTIFALRIEIEAVPGMFDRRNLVSRPHEFRNDPLDERRLAAVRSSHKADDRNGHSGHWSIVKWSWRQEVPDLVPRDQ